MERNGCDIEEFIKIRKDFHRHAEIAFQENRTHKKIYDLMLSYGIDQSMMKVYAGTGLCVNIWGQGAASGKAISIAIRADMDALPMPEHNSDLEYKTVTSYAHMCGHDGHMAMLLAAASVIIKQR